MMHHRSSTTNQCMVELGLVGVISQNCIGFEGNL
jgi:hypothetical protein